jgi:hypothetical protein
LQAGPSGAVQVFDRPAEGDRHAFEGGRGVAVRLEGAVDAEPAVLGGLDVGHYDKARGVVVGDEEVLAAIQGEQEVNFRPVVIFEKNVCIFLKNMCNKLYFRFFYSKCMYKLANKCIRKERCQRFAQKRAKNRQFRALGELYFGCVIKSRQGLRESFL